MGNCLAMQYGGSQAHSQYFHRQRGDWNAKVQSRDLVTTLTRIYNNNLNDAEKQQAMNLFLGNFVPHPGKPAVWELGSDKHLHAGVHPAIGDCHRHHRASSSPIVQLWVCACATVVLRIVGAANRRCGPSAVGMPTHVRGQSMSVAKEALVPPSVQGPWAYVLFRGPRLTVAIGRRACMHLQAPA